MSEEAVIDLTERQQALAYTEGIRPLVDVDAVTSARLPMLAERVVRAIAAVDVDDPYDWYVSYAAARVFEDFVHETSDHKDEAALLVALLASIAPPEASAEDFPVLAEWSVEHIEYNASLLGERAAIDLEAAFDWWELELDDPETFDVVSSTWFTLARRLDELTEDQPGNEYYAAYLTMCIRAFPYAWEQRTFAPEDLAEGGAAEESRLFRVFAAA